MIMEEEILGLDSEGLAVVWAQIVANFTTLQQASVLANGIGMLSATVRDHSDSLGSLDGRLTDVEGYFSGGIANNANMLGGKQLNELFETLSSGTTNAVSIKVGGVTKNISQSTLRTSLGLDTAAYHSHGTYMTEISISGTQLAWKKGDSSQTALTIPYATKALNDNDGNDIRSTYLKLSGGTMNGDLTLARGKKLQALIPNTSTNVALIQLNSSNEVVVGETSSKTIINGYPIVFKTSAQDRLTIANDGKVTVAGATEIGGTLSAGATTLSSLGVTNNATVGGTLGVTGATTLSSLSVTGNATVGGTLGVTGNTTLSGTLSVTENISGSKNIQAAKGVSAGGIAELGIAISDTKYEVTSTTVSSTSSTYSIAVARNIDGPTYQLVTITGTATLRLIDMPSGYDRYCGSVHKLRIYNNSGAQRTIQINFRVISDKKTLSLNDSEYVEIEFFWPVDGEYPTVIWSEILTYQ